MTGVTLLRREEVGDMGSIVFPASNLMVTWMKETQQQNMWSGQNVVELGAGTGLVGITAATLGAHNVVISDLPVYVHAIQENIEYNRHIIQAEASARNIDWTEPVAEDLVGSADVVIVCDCVYYEASLQPLVRTIRDLLKNADSSCVIFAYEERPDKMLLYQQFFELLHKHFVVTEILNKRLETGNQMFLYQLNKS